LAYLFFQPFLTCIQQTNYSRGCILMSFFKKKQKLKIKTSIRISNNCIFNNRSKSVLRPYGISRILIRDLMQFGVLPGYSKAVW